MKTNQWKQFALVFLLGQLCLNTSRVTAQHLKLTWNSTDANYKYEIEGGTLPALMKSGAYFKVFLNTGDGHYYMKDLIVTSPQSTTTDLGLTHNYASTSITVTPYVELTPVYDDTKPPGGMYKYTTQGNSFTPTNTGTIQASVPMDNTTTLLLRPVRKIVAGDFITFAATVQNKQLSGAPCFPPDWTGAISLTYDPGLFTAISVNGSPVTGNTGYLAAQVTQQLPLDKQTTVFFTLRTSSTAILNDATVLRADILPNACLSGSREISDMKVELSHDPNRKVAETTVVNTSEDEITYRVYFQNIGIGGATKVLINDELDPHLLNIAPVFVSTTAPNPPMAPKQIGDTRTWQWQFNYSNTDPLKGTGNPQYLIDFADEYTWDELVFKVRVDTAYSCGAILNRATVYFDCNKPYETKTTITPISCTTDISSCGDPSIKWLTGWTNLVDGAPLPQLLTASDLSSYSGIFSTGSGWRFKWYPSENVTQSWARNPGLYMARTGVYTLVASKGPGDCRRQIFHVRVQTIAGLPNQHLHVLDNPGDCQANLSIFGGVQPYTVNWSYKYFFGLFSGSATGPSLSLSGKTQVVATIKDASSCPAITFTPVSAMCGFIDVQQPKSWFIGIAIVFIIGAGVYFMRRNR